MTLRIWFGITLLCAVLCCGAPVHAKGSEPTQNLPTYQEIIKTMMMHEYKAIALQINEANSDNNTEQEKNLSPALSLRQKELLSTLENAIKTEAENHLGVEFPVFTLDKLASKSSHAFGENDILFYEINIDFDTNKADEKDTTGTLNTALYRMIHLTGQKGLSRSPYTAKVTSRSFLVFSPEADKAMRSAATDLAIFIETYATYPRQKQD